MKCFAQSLGAVKEMRRSGWRAGVSGEEGGPVSTFQPLGMSIETSGVEQEARALSKGIN